MHKKITPVDLVVLLQIHYLPDCLEEMRKRGAESEKKAIAFWLAKGLIRPTPGHDGYETTRKGKFFIEYLCSQPLPVEESTYHIPKPREE